MGSGEDIQRQIAVVIVVAVKLGQFLLAVQRDIGGIHIQNEFGGGACGGWQ